METIGLNPGTNYDQTPTFDDDGGGIIFLFLILALVLVAGFIGRMVDPRAQDDPLTNFRCPPHKWARTDPKPGAIQVLRCTQCPKICGTTDEWGRPTGDAES